MEGCSRCIERLADLANEAPSTVTIYLIYGFILIIKAVLLTRIRFSTNNIDSDDD